MKIKIFNITKIFFAVLAMLPFTACDNDDLVPEFTLQEASEQVAFLNSVSPEYLLSAETSNNIAERFVWNEPNFGVPTGISYSVEGSISETFATIDYESGVISETNHAVIVSALMGIALDETLLDLDTDPNTTDNDGNPNNTGKMYFRVKAFVGSGQGQDAKESISETVVLNITLIEDTGAGSGIEKSTWGVVGSGYNAWGAPDGPLDAPFYTTAVPGVIVSYVNLLTGQIKFRENNTWGGDLGDANLDGILDTDDNNNIDVVAGDYKITINTNDNSYTIEEFSWGIVGSGFNNWGSGGLDAKLYYDYITDTFKASVKLFDGFIKFRPLNTWSGDLGDANLDGILDSDSDNNIPVTEGHYLITVNLNDNSYTIETAPVWGVVGSGYNNWGGDEWDHDGDAGTPDVKVSDAALTEIQPGVWFAENISLIDGQIKFRADNTWGGDLGDANLDNILDSDDNNNIDVVAGNYVITIDFNDADGPKYRLGKR